MSSKKQDRYANQCPECGRPTHEKPMCNVCTIEKLKKALAFYADEDSYFAIGVMGDSPCGDFIEDFEYSHEYERDVPGKRARQTLKEVFHAEDL